MKTLGRKGNSDDSDFYDQLWNKFSIYSYPLLQKGDKDSVIKFYLIDIWIINNQYKYLKNK